jgi:hypothetical protein
MENESGMMKPMKPRDRVIAALTRQPVDRIPYCEHLVDSNVARRTIGPLKSAKIIAQVGKHIGVKNLLAVLAVSRNTSRLNTDPELRTLAYRAMGLMEPLISKELHRDNITIGAGHPVWPGGYL